MLSRRNLFRKCPCLWFSGKTKKNTLLVVSIGRWGVFAVRNSAWGFGYVNLIYVFKHMIQPSCLPHWLAGKYCLVKIAWKSLAVGSGKDS